MRRHSLFVLIVLCCSLPLRAQCPVDLAVNGPDGDGKVTIVAHTSGTCGRSQFFLKVDGQPYGLGYTCFDATQGCTMTEVINAQCWSAGAHPVELTVTCGRRGTDAQGHEVCLTNNGTNSGSFTLAPTPTISVTHDGPDSSNLVRIHANYHFQYNRAGRIRIFFDDSLISGPFTSGPDGTVDTVTDLTCASPGQHQIVAKALACAGFSPEFDPSDPNFIATANDSVSVSGQTTLSASYDEDSHQLTVRTNFPNTGGRDLAVYLDGSPLVLGWSGDCRTQQSGTCTTNFAVSCGASHALRVTAQGCRRPEPMYNAEQTLTVAVPCPTDSTGCHQSPSTSEEQGAGSSGAGCCQNVCPSNPVNVGSGDVSATIPLFTIDQEPTPLRFALTYHSLKPSFNYLIGYPMGAGWTHTFNSSVQPVTDKRLMLYTGTGNRLYFDQLTSNLWSASRPAFVTDTITKDIALGAYTLKYPNGGRSLYSIVTGKWLSTSDRWNNTIAGTYDGSGNLATISDSAGRQIALEYTNNLLTRIVLPGGAAWQFNYTFLGSSDVLNSISSPINSAIPWRTFSYLSQLDGVYRSLTAIRDSAGKLLEGHGYFSDGRGVSTVAESGRDAYTFEYDTPSSGKTRVTRKINDSISQVAVYSIDRVKGAIVATQIDGVCPGCGATTDSQTFTHDNSGRILTTTDAGGHITSYTYDPFGSVLSKTEALGTPLQRTITYGYENPGWATFVTKTTTPSATGNGLKIILNQWNAGETVLTTTEVGKLSADPVTNTTYSQTWTFDSRHRLLSRDGPRTDVSDVATRSYYSDFDPDVNRRGRLAQMMTPSGLVTIFDDYDIHGTPRKVTDANGVVTQLTTDLRGRVTSSTSKAVPGDPNESTDYTAPTTYDLRDRLIEQTNPRGAKTRYRYEDGTNRLTDVIRADLSGNEVERKHLTLDIAGNKIAEEDQACDTPAATCASWSTRRSASFLYDLKDRLVEIDQPVPAGAKIAYQYDSDGRLRSVQDENHSTPNTTYAYDELNRLFTATQAAGTGMAVTRYGYDLLDNLTSLTDPNGNLTMYEYDDFGRMQRQISPVTGTTSYSYDPAGNLVSINDANATITARTYDASNRILTSLSARSGTATESMTWSYDDRSPGNYGVGRLAAMIDPTGSTSYRYERRGLLASEMKTIEGSIYGTLFKYDAAGNRARIVYPSGRAVDYLFDHADRPLSATTGAISLITSAAYAPFGPLTRLNYSNGALKSVQYDQRYRPVENKLTTAAGTIADYTYVEDPTGNVTQIRDAVDPGFNRDFGYDDLNRLVRANTGASLWSTGGFSYDLMGNLQGLNLGTSRSATFSYLAQTPKLTSVTENGTAKSVAYDPAGNEVSVGDETFSYSARNSLGVTARQEFVYDGRGIRTITLQQGNLASLTLDPSVTTGGGAVTCTVNLTSPASGTGVVVFLTSNTAAASVPRNVLIPSGAATTTFTIPTQSVSAEIVAIITASAANIIRSASLTIRPPTVVGLEIAPPAVVAGDSATGTVVLSGAAPAQGATVSLSSNNALVSVPPGVTIIEGSSRGTFSVTTSVSSATQAIATVKASYGGDVVTATLTVNPPPVTLATLILQPSTVVGGLNATGVITLTSAAPASGATIALLSSDTSSASAPNSVVVSAGAATASFDITTVSTLSVKSVPITASYNGVSQTSVLTITPPATLSLLALNIDPINAVGGSPAVGTVILTGPAPNGGADVMLNSSDPSTATVPLRASVRRGETSAIFDITTRSVTSATTATISGSYGELTQHDTLTVIPPTAIHLLSINLNPPGVIGGLPSIGTVTVDTPAPVGGIVVSLACKQKKLVTLPDRVVVPGGSTAASFTIATQSVRRTDTADIRASFAGVTRTATLTLTPSVGLLQKRWTTLWSWMERRQKPRLSFSFAAPIATATAGSARRYSLYSPELNLIAETDTTTNTPTIANEYIWFGGQPIAQINNATGEVAYYFNDHLGTPLLQTSATGSVIWRVEREPYGRIFSTRAGSERYQPLAFPGQEEDGVSDRSYNIFRWYQAARGKYTQFDPIGNTYWAIAMGSRIFPHVPLLNLPSITDLNKAHPFAYGGDNPITNSDARGLRVQTIGCDGIPDCLENRVRRQCCACHDICFFANNCEAGRDWPGTASYLATLISTPFTAPPPPCVQCNLWAAVCFGTTIVSQPRGAPPCPWHELPGTFHSSSGRNDV